jgi:hypothetical protein
MDLVPGTDRVPPALLAHLRYVFTYFDPVEPSPAFIGDFEGVVAQGRPWWSRAPELAELGYRLIAPSNHPEVRRRGCTWLGYFPSVEMAGALRDIALSDTEPRTLRDQAIWTLGYRQLQRRHDDLYWAPEVVALADATLLAIARTPNAKEDFGKLSLALRHCRSPEILELFASDPTSWSNSIECFADARLARALLEKLPQISPEDEHRVLRLVADTLGAEACGPLLDYATTADYGGRFEALLAALAVDAPQARPHVDSMLASMKDKSAFAARAHWHEANPGVLPTVRALRVARTTATLPADARTEACREASDGFASQAKIALFAEAYLYEMWRHVALRAKDAARVAAVVEAHPSALDEEGVLRPYLEALAAAGRFRKLVAAAERRDSGALPAWLLATHGRPFLALAVRSGDRSASALGVAAQALALLLAGRPDLARRTLSDEQPRARVLPGTDRPPAFPGPDEAWQMVSGADDARHLRALAGGIHGLVACAEGAPRVADPDVFDLSLLSSFERSLRRDLSGATVFLAGKHSRPSQLAQALTDKGARIADGPFAGIDFFIVGEQVPLDLVVRLERQGARRIDDPREKRGAG